MYFVKKRELKNKIKATDKCTKLCAVMVFILVLIVIGIIIANIVLVLEKKGNKTVKIEMEKEKILCRSQEL